MSDQNNIPKPLCDATCSVIVDSINKRLKDSESVQK